MKTYIGSDFVTYEQIRDCYDRKYGTNEYNSTWAEVKRLSEFEIEKRQTNKFVSYQKSENIFILYKFLNYFLNFLNIGMFGESDESYEINF